MLLAAAIAAAIATPDPEAIFARARGRWEAQSYPRYLSYRVVVSAFERGTPVANTYASFTDTVTNQTRVRATSAEEAAHPYVPHGAEIKAKVTVSYAGKPRLGAQPSVDGGGVINVSKTMQITPQQQYDVLGVPLLSPAYSFGLVPAAAASSNAPSPASAQPLKTIASVTAVRRDYTIAYDGIETAGGVPCYHLTLTPRRDPGRLRLRQLWIDTASYALRQAVVQGNFTEGPGPTLPWRIRFTLRDNLIYIEDETALGAVSYLGRTYSGVTVAFEDIQTAAAPDVSWRLTMFRTSGDVLREPTP